MLAYTRFRPKIFTPYNSSSSLQYFHHTPNPRWSDQRAPANRRRAGPVGRGASCDFERTARHAEERTSGNAQVDRNTVNRRRRSNAANHRRPHCLDANATCMRGRARRASPLGGSCLLRRTFREHRKTEEFWSLTRRARKHAGLSRRGERGIEELGAEDDDAVADCQAALAA